MQGAGNLCYRIHSLKYLRSIRHRVANIKGLEIRKSQFVAKTKFPSKMKRIRNVVFRFFFDIWNFFLNWKILPFERSTFSLFYLLNVLPFVVLPYNRSTFFHSTFFNSTFCNSTFCNSTFFTGAQINFIFPFLRRTQILQRLKKPKFFLSKFYF